MSRRMEQPQPIDALSALAQPTRLGAFRQLIAAYPEAVPAGEIARRAAVPHNTMSTHLATLTRAGLVTVSRESRSMLYRADLDGFRALVGFLTQDCCAGHPEICTPLFAEREAACSCQPESVDG